MATRDMTSFLVSHLWAFPYLLVFVIGLAVSAANWSKCPRVAALSGVAFLILLGTLFAGIALSVWTMLGWTSSGDIGRVYQVFGLARAVFDVVAYGMLVTAVFIDRAAKFATLKEFR